VSATSSRDPVRTRRALLDGAARAVTRHGAIVSLEVIARDAGVSKGGLLHHFASKDALLVALVEDLLEQFSAAVHEQLDPADEQPGRLVRAYVRATFDGLGQDEQARELATLMAALGNLPEVVRVAQEDGQRWKDAFAADGLDPHRATVITRAADGVAMAFLFEGHLDEDERDSTRDLLLALTRQAGPLH